MLRILITGCGKKLSCKSELEFVGTDALDRDRPKKDVLIAYIIYIDTRIMIKEMQNNILRVCRVNLYVVHLYCTLNFIY